MKLEHGTKYRQIKTGKIFTLIQDYDGRSWYLSHRSEEGLTKTLSTSSAEMLETINNYFVEETTND